MTSTISFEDVNAVFGIQFDSTSGWVPIVKRHSVCRPCSMLDDRLEPTITDCHEQRGSDIAGHAFSGHSLGDCFTRRWSVCAECSVCKTGSLRHLIMTEFWKFQRLRLSTRWSQVTECVIYIIAVAP